jgi:3-oxoacyl-[acyl-carrier-protein] synthase-1
MSPLAITGVGMVTSIGLNRKATSAAFRANMDNFQESYFLDGNGEDLLVAEIPLEKPWRGKAKMLKMAALSIQEALKEAEIDTKQPLSVLICLPEQNGLGLEIDEQQFYLDLQDETGLSFSPESGILKKGKAGCISALEYAQELIYKMQKTSVLIIATDTLLTAKLVNNFTEKRWLLTRTTSNGFIPSEGAISIVVSRETAQSPFSIIGFGKADEPYQEGDETPFLAQGMTEAINNALHSANVELSFIDMWFSHNNTSYLSAKESTLAELKLLRGEGIHFERHALTQHFGEIGTGAGLLMLALSRELLRNGGNCLISMANFGARRAAILSKVNNNGE